MESDIKKNLTAYKKSLHASAPFDELSFFPKVKEILLKNRGSNILEIGCGRGAFFEMVKAIRSDLAMNFSAVDLDDFLRPEIRNEVNFVKVNMSTEKLPFDDSSFDYICGFAVLEHVENPWNFVREVHRVLKPGGHLLLSFPTGKDIFSRLKYLFTGELYAFTYDNGHIAVFTESTQKKLFRGFKLVDLFCPKFPVPLINSPKLRMPGKPFFANKRLHIYRKKSS